MPNWCVQNWILRGPKEDIQRFCDKVNSCLDRPGRKNGFGKYWLGNLCECFGYDYDELEKNGVCGLRGTFDPEPDQIATLSCSRPEYVQVSPVSFNDELFEVHFSITHAWGPSDWFQSMIDEQFPTLMQCWKATDEFGNFHSCRNGDAFGLKAYEIYSWGKDEEMNFDVGEEQQAVDFIKKISDGVLDLKPEELKESENFYSKISDYNESHEGEEIEIHFWEEE